MINNESFLIFVPDRHYFESRVRSIIRLSKIPEDEVLRVEINCGNGPGLGTIVKKNGEKVEV